MKQARVDAGLSLAQLGKGHVTAPAIYLIETGRTRPSMPTLEHIARRTGKPVEFFLAEPDTGSDPGTANLLAMNLMVAEGRISEAIQLGRSLLEGGTSGFRLGSIRFQLAQAYLNSSEPELAEPLLAEARQHFEAVGDGAMIATCIGAQAVLANLTHSKDAVALARQALEVCQGLSPRPFGLELRLYTVLAAAHMEMGEWEAAIEANSRAVELGTPLLDARNLADAFGKLGHAYVALGQSENAARYLLRSLGLMDLLRDRALLATAENNIGLAMLRSGDIAGARAHLERALGLAADSNDDGVNRRKVLLALAELSIEQGELEGASTAARDALDEALRHKDAASAAEAHLWLGRIAVGTGDDGLADTEFEQAIQGFQQLGLHERLLHAHGVYAEVLERRGDLAKAYIHMKQALRVSRPRPSGQQDDEERLSSA